VASRDKFNFFLASPDPNGGAWLGSFDRVRGEVNGRFTDIKFPQSFLPNPQPVRIASDNLGALWVSGSFGVLVLRGGKWNTVGLPPGFPGKTPTLVYADIAGRGWLGFKENAFMLIDWNAQRVLSEKDGLHVGAILAVSVLGASNWVAGSNGLQFFDGNSTQCAAAASRDPLCYGHGKRYASFANSHLPKLTRDLDIAYTALSLTGCSPRERQRYA
jgi:hypothetical protein